MHDDINSDADLDALFRQAAEAVQSHYESILWGSAENRQQGTAADQASPGNSTLNKDTLSVLDRPNPVQRDASYDRELPHP